MKRMLVFFAGVVLSSVAAAQVPESVVNSCVLLQGVDASTTYQELGGDGILIEDDMPGYVMLVYRRNGVDFGYASSKKNSGDLLIVGRQRASILGAKRAGTERPERFEPAQALYGFVQRKAREYFCVASTFEGVGRSGSFQNVRATYIAELTGSHAAPRIRALYYAVRDIRKIKADGRAVPTMP